MTEAALSRSGLVETKAELEALRAAGRVVANTIRAMRRNVRRGSRLPNSIRSVVKSLLAPGRDPVPKFDYGFPGVNCIRVNDEAVHGLPRCVDCGAAIWSSSTSPLSWRLLRGRLRLGVLGA